MTLSVEEKREFWSKANSLKEYVALVKERYPDPPLDLERTSKALEKYDAIKAPLDVEFDRLGEEGTGTEINAFMEKMDTTLDKAADEVGCAFGHDTADRNNFEDCRKYACPGRSGSTDEWLRRLVNEWREGKP